MEQDDFNFETDNFPGDELEDKILAKALEESLRHYREVEVPLRESQQRAIPAAVAGPSRTVDKDEEVTEPVLYRDSDVEGFDLSAGRNWIYPTNYPIRNYQFSIVQTALYNNTLVSLPTGLGKTFIAAVVMYNFYRWFPCGKVIFMAPTKPLVNQQIDSCYNVMGIPKEDTAELTGTMSPLDRAKAWKEKRVFFATPQVITNDLTCGICPAASLKCVVVDEAHKATGNHSYCQVIKALLPFNQKFRMLALSATPGSDEQAVIQVVKNLLISKVEIRSEDSPDVVQFTHKRNVEKIVVPLGGYLSTLKKRFTLILDHYIRNLQQHRVLYGSVSSLSKFKMLKCREMYRQNPPPHINYAQKGLIEADFAVCVSLLHSLELLSEHGLRSCLKFIKGVVDAERGQAVVQRRLAQNEELKSLLQEVEEKLGPDTLAEPEPDVSLAVVNDGGNQREYICSHPKLEKLREVVVAHFQSFQEKNIVTRAMIFCQYRDTVIEVCHILQEFRPLVKPMTFVGQSTVGKMSKGFTQKQQLKVMEKFRSGGYNTLISTCVGEEGLDIGDVDLIVCYDAHKSPIRLVQRMGRTGRKREGRIIMLLTEGNEHNKYKTSMYQSNTVNKKLLQKKWLDPHLYMNSPRMIPNSLQPVCYKMFITLPAATAASTSKRSRKGANQDIRKLFSAVGDKKRDIYCSQQNWSKDIIPAFDRLAEPEELHAKTLGEIFGEEEEVMSKKIDFSEHLDWQRTLQDTVQLPHSEDTKDLVHLLQYAEEKRTALQPTQGRALLSQVNCSLMWPNKRKGKRKATAKPRTKASVTIESKKLVCLQETECSTATTHFAAADAQTVESLQNDKIDNELKTQTPLKEPEIIEIQDESEEKMDVDCGNNKELRELVNLLKTVTSKLLGADTNNTSCYLCSIGVCNLNTAEVQHRENPIQKYQPINVTVLQSLTKQDIINVNIEDLISPPNSPIVVKSLSCHDKVNATEYDALNIKNKNHKKPHFDLNFSFLPPSNDEKKSYKLATTSSKNELPDVKDFENATFSNLNTSTPHKNNGILTKNKSHKAAESTSLSTGNIFTDIVGFEDTEVFSLDVKNQKDEETFTVSQNSPRKVPSESVEAANNINVSTHDQEFKYAEDFNLNIVSHRNKTAASSVKKVSKNKLSKSGFKRKLSFGPDSVDSEKIDDIFISQQFATVKAKKAATPQKVHSILNVERERPEISPFKFKESMSQQPVEVINDTKASREEVNDVLPLSPILCHSQRTQQHHDHSSPIFPKGSSTPKVHKKSLFFNTNLEDARNDVLLGESKDGNVKIVHPKLNFDLMSSFKRICGSSSDEEKDTKQNQPLGNTQNISLYTVTQLVNMIDTSDSQATHKEQESVKQPQALSLSAKRKLSTKSFLLDSEDDIFAELDLENHTNSKSNEFNDTKGKHVPDDFLKHNTNHSTNQSDITVAPPAGYVETNTTTNKITVLDQKQSTMNKPLHSEIKTVKLSSPILEKHAKNNAENTNICDTYIPVLPSVEKLSKTVFNPSLEKPYSPNHRLQVAEEDSPFIDKRGKKRKLALNFSTSSESYIERNEGTTVNTTPKKLKDDNEKIIIGSGWLNAKNGSPPESTKKKVKRPRKETGKISNKGAPKVDNKVIELSSEDSDFESQYIVKKKTVNVASVQANVSASTVESTSPVKKKKKTRKPATKDLDQKCRYVESEAEVSAVIEVSSDDEDTSGLDEYDSSFVSDTSHVNDADQDDAQVKFLQSIIRSPVKGHRGKFKIPATVGKVPFEDVFSQIEEAVETSYLEDSFCVEDGEEEPEENEISHLELAEAVLEAEEAEENWKKRKRKCSKSGSSIEEPAVPHVKRKRIIILDDSDSEGDTNKAAEVIIPKHLETDKEDLTHFFEDADFPELESVFVSSKEPPQCKESLKKDTSGANNICSNSSITGANVNTVINDRSCATHTKRDHAVESDSTNKHATPPRNSSKIDDTEPSSPVFVCSGRPKRPSSKVARSLSLEYGSSKVPAASTSHKSLPEVTEAGASTSKNTAVLEMVQRTSILGEKENKVSVIMSTRQIASAPEIATALRAQYEIALLVKSITEADYIVSWKTGILRVTISEFIRGNFTKSSDSEEMSVLRSEFMQPYVIIENDKTKPISTTVGVNSELWNDKTAVRVMNVTSAGITVLFSANKADTARLIAHLANMESRNGRIISDLPSGSPILESRLQYYHSLPAVNLALAMKLCTSFSNIMEFIKRCVSVNKIQEVTGLSREKAARIYLALHHAADERAEK